MSLPPADQHAAFASMLSRVTMAVEDLLLTGLSAASAASREALSVSFDAASRMRFLRLGFTLRVATEELGRFTRNDPSFSRRRYGFFLNRAWMLARGMTQALDRGDENQWLRLTSQPVTRSVPTLDLIGAGVSKRVVPGAFAAFEFRLRVLRDGDLPSGTPLVWSAVYPLRTDVDVPSEAYLQFAQAQGFKPTALLPGLAARVTHAQIADASRLTLAKESKVEPLTLKSPPDWSHMLRFDASRALERVSQQSPSPFDLEVELQEEVGLEGFTVGTPETLDREQQLRYPIEGRDGLYHATVGTGPEDEGLRRHLDQWAKKKPQKGLLYGLLHYEMCRFAFQPLTYFGAKGPVALQLRDLAFDPTALVKALKFT